jgi:hypothetical protein
MLQSLCYLTIALHVSGIIVTHLQEHKTTVTTVSGNRYTVLLSAAIVEELELIIYIYIVELKYIVYYNSTIIKYIYNYH